VPLNYKIFLSNQSKKELSKIKKGDLKSAQLISNALNELQKSPQIGEFLHGDLRSRRKLRVGNYRIIYSIEKDQVIIYIFRIAHRKDVYR